uniref:Uncharacterized protein n=1 Tax=Anguilla anguilla TaxID=7936 RepID=A0A0E9WJD5_ANGAN
MSNQPPGRSFNVAISNVWANLCLCRIIHTIRPYRRRCREAR